MNTAPHHYLSPVFWNFFNHIYLPLTLGFETPQSTYENVGLSEDDERLDPENKELGVYENVEILLKRKKFLNAHERGSITKVSLQSLGQKCLI